MSVKNFLFKNEKFGTDLYKRIANMLLTTLHSIGDGVLVTDVDGKILILNKSAEEMTGYTQQEALGENICDIFKLVHEYSGKAVENPVKKVLKEKNKVELPRNTLLINKDGTKRAIADSAAPITNGEDKIWGVILVFRDDTEKRQITRNLKKAKINT